jgi:NADPH2:quinone reductase
MSRRDGVLFLLLYSTCELAIRPSRIAARGVAVGGSHNSSGKGMRHLPDDTMLAVRFRGPAPDREVVVESCPVPAPGDGEILVRVHAAGLNRADLIQRKGAYPPPGGAPDDAPGLEYAGEVAAVGNGVTLWQTGDRVCGLTTSAAQAQYLTTHELLAAPAPVNLGWTDVAAIPEVFITAADALWEQAELKPSDRVLIHAVGSGVGLAAIQLVRAMGAIPYGATRTTAKLEIARDLGLEDGIATSDPESCARWMRAVTHGHGVDALLDLVGGPWTAAGMGALAPRGRLILVGLVAGVTAELSLRTVLSRRLTIRGTVLRARPLEEKIMATQLLERRLLPLFASGNLAPNVFRVLPLTEAAAAYELLGSNETAGKVVLDMG